MPDTKSVFHPLLSSLRGGLIVSCQAPPGSPLDSSAILAAFARCAEMEGAAGIRANHGPNIAAIRAAVRLPIIGIRKRETPDYTVYITPEWSDAREVYEAGAQIIALDATARPRPGPEDFTALTRRIHAELGAAVMADVSTLEEGIAAAKAGADLVATTLSGYTVETQHRKSAAPDLELVRQLARAVDVPVICEGRVQTPEQARAALEAGAWAVVVGTAITRPDWIAAQYVAAMRRT
jgi:putative N-acetylmannosamine-6-phosphate epimerase